MTNQLENGKMDLTINAGDMNRAQDVVRWHIVPNNKKQSVAEHSWAVAMIANQTARMLEQTLHVHLDKGSMLEYAILHDIEEVIVGDTPTPVKQFMKTITGFDAYDEMGKSLCRELREAKTDIDPVEMAIVKFADLLEADVYASKYVTDEKYRMGLLVNLDKAIVAQVEKLAALLSSDHNVKDAYNQTLAVANEIKQQLHHGQTRLSHKLMADVHNDVMNRVDVKQIGVPV